MGRNQSRVRLIGLKETLGIFKRERLSIVSDLQKITEKNTRNIERDAKRDSAVDTGENRAGIVAEMSSDKLTGTVTANAPHAPFLEFGTGNEIDVPEGFEAVAIEFKGEGKRTINRSPQPFLIPNFLKTSVVYREDIRNILRSRGIKFQTRV